MVSGPPSPHPDTSHPDSFLEHLPPGQLSPLTTSTGTIPPLEDTTQVISNFNGGVRRLSEGSFPWVGIIRVGLVRVGMSRELGRGNGSSGNCPVTQATSKQL